MHHVPFLAVTRNQMGVRRRKKEKRKKKSNQLEVLNSSE